VPASPPLNTGDGIKAAQALGAATGGTQEAWWFPVIHFPGEEWAPGAPYRRLTMAERSHPGSIMVNARGRRFVDEAASYHHVGRSFLAPDESGMGYANSPAWLIFDANFRRSYRLSALAAGSEDPEWLDKADTLEALAERVGIDPAGLVAQVARFNEGAARGLDEDFGRGTTDHDRACGDPFAAHPNLAPLTEAPFYAVPVLPGMLGTKGGLRTDHDGAVLHASGGRIAALFAAGNCTENVTGGAYPGPGGTLGPALVGGYCAGRAAARTAVRAA
jgi:3-oxosteroid 1-dehydrogenase